MNQFAAERISEGIRANHAPNILMFDVPPPFLSRGLDAYTSTWQIFFPLQAKPIAFDFEEVKVTAGSSVGAAKTSQVNCFAAAVTFEAVETRPNEIRYGSERLLRTGSDCSITNLANFRISVLDSKGSRLAVANLATPWTIDQARSAS
jgi:hypothetical protein